MRNRELEREFLAKTIAQDADAERVERFLRAVDRRMSKGAEEYGDASYHLPFPETVAQAVEEGEDFPAWLSIGVHALRRDDTIPPATREHLETMLVAASAKVFEAWQIIELAREMYEDDQLPPPPPEPVSCIGSM